MPRAVAAYQGPTTQLVSLKCSRGIPEISAARQPRACKFCVPGPSSSLLPLPKPRGALWIFKMGMLTTIVLSSLLWYLSAEHQPLTTQLLPLSKVIQTCVWLEAKASSNFAQGLRSGQQAATGVLPSGCGASRVCVSVPSFTEE